MIKIDEDRTTIRLTRGDKTTDEYNKLAIYCPFEDTGEYFKFKPTDKIKIVVFDKKGYTREEILKKEYFVSDLGYFEETESIEIVLTDEETKEFPESNKPITYWYDIVLNDSTTIIGYDEEGAKKFIVYPEAGEEE